MPQGERDGALWLPPEKDVRRLLMLIFEGWVPQDKFASRGCLALGTEIAAQALPPVRPTNNVVEGSPVAAAAPRSPCGRLIVDR